MKATFLILLALLFGCTTLPTEVPALSIIAIKEKAHTPHYWKPTEKQVSDFENQLSILFSAPDKRFRGAKGTHLSSYIVWYYGHVQNGRKVIIARGAAKDLLNEDEYRKLNRNPHASEILGAYGGGAYYFTAEWDFEDGKLLVVQFNAPV